MSVYAIICDWLRDEYEKKNLVPTLEELERRREEIAEKFELLPKHREISIAFEKYLTQLPRKFIYSDRVKIINGNKQLDSSWITENENRFYWNNLKNYLHEINRGNSITSLDLHSEEILKNLAPSNSTHPIHVKGLVVGYIQSGKTANMVALSAKAVDSGYKMVIVLGGLLNSLRQQTQIRFEQELTGGDKTTWQNTWKNLSRVKIKKIDQNKRWQRFTSAESENPNKGDFKAPSSAPFLNQENQLPNLFVIKKMPQKIKALSKFIKDTCGGTYPYPVLILDDESDQATINTKYDKYDVTSSNESIRELLSHFSVCSYVGYTATPYANILIDPIYTTAGIGRDLFPKDFIYPIDPPPPGYFGARELFGVNLIDAEKNTPGLDVFCNIPREEIILLNRAKDNLSHLAEVKTLLEAIDTFIISSALRLSRNHNNVDFSMLIHPSSYTHIQNIIYNPLVDYVKELKNKLSNETQFKLIINRLEKLYHDNFRAKSINCLKETNLEIPMPNSILHLKEQIAGIISSIDVLLLHSGSKDKLMYGDKDHPKRYIIVGGNKLSRGLTIEGLSVSYFCRNSKTYDTLLQMGRWFGYREAYVDLTRIYISNEAKDNFQNVALAELDLREQLTRYADENKSPLEIPPKILKLPNLLITARNKMGAGKRQVVDFVNYRPEKTQYDFNNLESLNEFNKQCILFLKNQITTVSHLKKSNIEGEYIFHSNISSDSLLNNFISKVDLGNIDRELITQYLSKNNEIKWVSLIAGKNTSPEIEQIKVNDQMLSIKGLKRSIRFASLNRFGTILGTMDLTRFKKELDEEESDGKTGMIIFHFIDTTYIRSFFTEIELPKYIIAPVFVFPQKETELDFDRFGINAISDDEKEALLNELPLLIDDEDDEE